MDSVHIELPDEVNRIISVLETAGFEAYAVGGCVRDSLLGRTPTDWDITTSADPTDVQRLFSRTIPTGIEHGTVTVREKGRNFEVTTFRIDGKYSDARHPESVTFTSSLEEDLARRDFTVNAMAYSPGRGLVDLFGGQDDLRNKVIRAVGDPRQRFGEDALRMLRALRFAAQLSFDVDEDTADAVRELCGTLQKISAERIRTELEKLLLSGHPELLEQAYRLGVTGVILPEFDSCMETPQNNRYHCYNVGIHTIEAIKAAPAEKVLRLSMLLHDIGKPGCRYIDSRGRDRFPGHAEKSVEMADAILRRLKYDNDTRRKVTKLVELHDEPLPEGAAGLRVFIHEAGRELFPLLLEVKRADIMAKNPDMRREKLAVIDRVREKYDRILADGDCLGLDDLCVNGQDLIALGISPGREIGEILRRMLMEVLNDPSHNNKEFLLNKYAKLQEQG